VNCPDCGRPLTRYREDGSDPSSPYNEGDLVGRCDNPGCVGEGSTWRIKASREKSKGSRDGMRRQARGVGVSKSLARFGGETARVTQRNRPRNCIGGG